MKKIDKRISCAFLYSISKYGYPPPPEGMATYIDEMASLGFQTIEIEGIEERGIDVLYAAKTKIKDALSRNTVSLPVFCTVLPRLCSPDAVLSLKAMECFRKGCELAAFFGARGVLDNGPLVPYDFPKDMPVHRHYSEDVVSRVGFRREFNWSKYHDTLLELMTEACRTAGEFGLDYYMHPCLGALTGSTDSYLLLKKELGCRNLKFTLDTSNLHYMRENLTFDVLKLAGELDYIHVSDSFGTRIEHQPLGCGKGNIDWESFFKVLKRVDYKGILAIDVGGDESGVTDIDGAYLATAGFLQKKINDYEI